MTTPSKQSPDRPASPTQPASPDRSPSNGRPTGTSSQAGVDVGAIGASLLAGTANIIMQLARPGVGHGVVESTVESGQVFRHPLKRSRTTFSYLAVAMMGSDEERELYKRAVNGAHAAVRSGPSSPVEYNAFDPELQLWVAACLYKGVEDTYEAFVGPLDELDEATAAELYREGSKLGTTLQVPPHMWPADRNAFHDYWNRALREVSIDDTVNQYLHELTELRFLPRPVSMLFGSFNRFVTTGFLPQTFRDEMGLPWSERQQRRFDRLTGAIGRLVRILPPVVRKFPFNFFLWDMRLRIKTGRRLV